MGLIPGLMAAHSSILAWRIPWTGESGGSHRVTNSWTGLKQLSWHHTVPRSSWEQMNLSTTLNIFSRIWIQLSPHLLYRSTYHSSGTIAFIDTGLSFINPIPKIESNCCPHLHPPWDSQNHILNFEEQMSIVLWGVKITSSLIRCHIWVLEKPMDREAWWATVHGIAQSLKRAWLKWLSMHAYKVW